MPAQLGINGFDRVAYVPCHFCETRCDNGHCPRPFRLLDHMVQHSSTPREKSTHHHECWLLDVKLLSTHHWLQCLVTSPRLLEANLILVVNKAFVFPGICCVRLLVELHDHRSCRVSGFTSLQTTRGTDGEVINVGDWKHISCGQSSLVQGLWCRTKRLFLTEIAAYEN